MRIGIDLDNTLVCYDQLFWTLAVERKWISQNVPTRKDSVRDELRRLGREQDWTLLQGEVYGRHMSDAVPFPGAMQAMRRFFVEQQSVFIVSHRTLKPVLGAPHDLHAAARNWLVQQGFLDRLTTGLSHESVFLETTKAEKLSRVGALGLTHFIDDLPEFLLDPSFPPNIQRILFDPHQHVFSLPSSLRVAHAWSEITELVGGMGMP